MPDTKWMRARAGFRLFSRDLSQCWNSLVAFLAPGAVLVVAFTQKGSDHQEHISREEWITALATCLVTSASVHATNRKVNGKNGDTGQPKDS